MQLCKPLEIDVLLLDMAFAAELVQQFQSMRPQLKIIGVKKNFEKPAIEAMRRLKMRGYVYINPFNKERTIECILAVARGELYFRFQDEK
jgi:DNA-binding NarL/FixJ family response regulator